MYKRRITPADTNNPRRYIKRFHRDAGHLKITLNQKRDWPTIIATGLPGLAAAVGLLFAFYSLRTDNGELQATRNQLSLSTQQLILNAQEQTASRLDTAIGDLASADNFVQLEGIYTLQGIMNANRSDQPVVVGVLCTYIRDSDPAHTSGTQNQSITGSGPSPSPNIQAALTILGMRHAAYDGDVVVDLDDSNLGGAQLTGADLSRATLVGANLEDANLHGVDLANANLNQADIAHADLTGVNLTNAQLTSADLAYSTLSDANFSEANLPLANLDYVDDILGFSNQPIVPPAQSLIIGNGPGAGSTYGGIGDLRKDSPNFENVELSGATLIDANLIGSNMTGADLFRANLSGASLAYTTLGEARLSYANLTHADLASANLAAPAPLRQYPDYNTQLDHANLDGANLTDSNLTDVQMTGADVAGVDTKGAILTGVRAYFTGR